MEGYKWSRVSAMTSRRTWQAGRLDEEEEESEVSQSQTTPAGSAYNTSSGVGSHGNSGVGPPPAYNGDRSIGVYEEYKIRARLWLRTTTIEEKARGPRLLQALTGAAFESMKHLAESDEWMDDHQNGQILLDEMSKPNNFGREDIESLWSALQKLFFTKLRLDDDDMVSFRTRFEESVRKVKKHGVELPSEALGFLFLKQMRVDSTTLERIITMTNGNLKLLEVMTAARKLKMCLMEDVDDKKKAPPVWLQEEEHMDRSSPMEGEAMDEELEILENALHELDGEQEVLNEDEARDVLMNLIKQKVSGPIQHMSYKQVQNTKKNIQNVRGFHAVNSHSGGKGRQDRTRDLSHLKSITKCRN